MVRPPRSTKAERKNKAALGFRAHSGWAAVVAVGELGPSPVVLDRRRIELVEGGVPKQPFHAAEGLDLARSEKIITRSLDLAMRLADRALRVLLADLRSKGYEVIGCGILAASGRTLPPLPEILASHALIHAAEGELFRNALVDVSGLHSLPVIRMKERELYVSASVQLRLPVEALRRYVSEMGRPLGPPWGQDQKCAALAGWLALAGDGSC
jgi:hypothetical protein